MFRSIAIALALASLAGAACAQTLYKLIDKNGKVTYSEEAPKNFDGKVIRIDVDPNRNTMTLPKGQQADPSGEGRPMPKRPARTETDTPPSPEDRLAGAQEKLKKAKEALAQAVDNPKEGDVMQVGKVGGGTRRVFSESYQQRLDALERAVKEAEDEVRRAERGV